MKKAIFFTIDSLLASGIIIISVLLVANFYSAEQQQININYASQDLVRIFSTMNVGEVNNDYAKSLIASGEITNTNNTILEQIGDFWAEDKIELAKNFTKNLTEGIIPSVYGFSVLVSDEEIYSRNLPVKRALVSSRKIISGIAKAKPKEGFTSRAYLSKITSKTNTKHYPFDVIAPCYNSMNDPSNADRASIEYTIELPNDAIVTNASWIIVPALANTEVDAYVNNNNVFKGVPNENSILNAQGNFTSGINKVRYNQTVYLGGGCPGDDGTSNVVLTYKTQQLQTIDNKTKFPFAVVYANGRISDYEKPIFAPNADISKINISLYVNASSIHLYFRFKATTIDIGSKLVTNNYVEWKDNDIKNNLSQSGISYNNLKDSYFYFIFDFLPFNNNVTILPNSSVILEGTQQTLPFGFIDVSQKIDLTMQKDPAPFAWCPDSYYNVSWGFRLPENMIPLYSDWVIGWCWLNDADQIAKANGIDLYRHIEGDSGTDPFIGAFARYGYTKNTASGSIVNGQNTFDLQFGSDYSTKPSISYGENVFIIPNSVTYTSVLGNAEGCTWKVQVNQGVDKIISVPKDYNGGNSCVFNQSDTIYNINDSNQIAALQIFEILDFDSDGDVDLLISEGDVEIETLTISKVPSLWGPAIIEIRVWE